MPFSDFLLFIPKAANDTEFDPESLPHKPGLLWRQVVKLGDSVLVVDSDNASHKLFAVASGQGHSIYLFGELYAYQGYQKPVKELLAIIAEDADAGRFRPEALNGHFALILVDASSGGISIFVDAVSFIPVYTFEHSKAFVFGSDFLAVTGLGSSKKLDWQGLASLFSVGYFLGERTFFEDVKILRPGTKATLATPAGPVRQQQYWVWSHNLDTRRSYGDTVGEFAHLLKAAVSCRMRYTSDERLAVGISGGLDSRTIVACLPKGADIYAYSYGYHPESIEIEIGRTVARAHKLAFTEHVIRSGYITELIEPLVRTTEGFSDILHGRQASFKDELGANADVMLTGLVGDILNVTAGGLANRGCVSRYDLASYVHNRSSITGMDWLVEHLCRPHLSGADPVALIKEGVLNELLRLDVADPAFQVKVYKHTQHVPRWTNAGMRVHQLTVFPRCPYYDRRVLEFYCTVPSKFVPDRRLQIDFLRRFSPHLANITWEPYGRNLYQQMRYYRYIELPRRTIGKAKGLLHDVKVVRRIVRKGRQLVPRASSAKGPAPVQRVCPPNWAQLLNTDGEELLERWLLTDTLLIHDLVPRHEIQLLLEEFKSNPWAKAFPVSALLTFSAWLEQYCK